ncbi:squalene/phytoene synthase family protein [Terricaulis sp.]|uniref:squalene/phytoene synthase family protein n=1 Tax=Terricaulis sp. TaxID=2768686 RepID=UPI00378309F6
MSADPALDLDADVRRYDEDRWLASRFAPAPVRKRLVVLYALNHEIARTSAVVTQEAIGDIRLAWWRDAIAEVHAGKPPRAHPVLTAYAEVAPFVDAKTWTGVIEARSEADFSAAPFAGWVEADAYVERTVRGVMELAAGVCGAGGPPPLMRAAGRAWGFANLLSTRPAKLPDVEEARRRVHAALEEARRIVFESALFPAIGYAALAPMYVRKAAPSLLGRQLKLIAASATGRL